MNKLKRIWISEETDRLLMTEVKDEFIKDNPKLRRVRMSRELIISWMIEERRNAIKFT